MIYLMANQKSEGIPAFQGKMSVQSMLAKSDLGIMIQNKNFGLKVTFINGDELFNDVGEHITYQK